MARVVAIGRSWAGLALLFGAVASLTSPSVSAQQTSDAAQRPWERCRAAGDALGEVARQRDRGLPVEAALIVVDQVWAETPQAAATWRRLVEAVYSERSAITSPQAASATLYNACVQQGARAQTPPLQPADPAVRERQLRMVEMMRAGTDTPAAAPDDQEKQHEMERRLAGVTPRKPGESEEDWRRRISGLAEVSLAPGRARAAEQERRAASIANLQQSQRVQQEARERAQREDEARREAEAHAPGQESFTPVYRQNSGMSWAERMQDLRAQKQRWCDNNPEPCARDQRRIAAQEDRARREEDRRGQWQVLHERERLCQPLPEWIPGVSTPQDALAAIRRRDPDADFQDAPSVTAGRPWVTIETSGEPVNLARDYAACLTWFRAAAR